MAANKFREEFKNPLNEGKLVSDWNSILKFMIKKLEQKLGKEFQKNKEKGIASINTVGSMVGMKVSDKKQADGKLFLKFGDNLDEEILKEEDAAVRAAKLKAQQVEEMEALKRKQVEEMDAMKERHERENEKIALDKEKEAENKAIEAERESARKAAQNEETINEGDYGRGGQKGSANIRGKSYFDNAIERGWEAALKDMLHGHIMQREFEKAFPAITKKDLKALLKSKEVKSRSQRWAISDREYKKKITQLMKGLKEELGADADVGDYIKDFRKSDAPQFKGKSDKKIRQMAIAAWKDAQNG